MDIEELVRVREETILLMMEQMERVHSENADLTLQLKSIAPLAESAAQLQTDLSTLRESVRIACIPAIPALVIGMQTLTPASPPHPQYLSLAEQLSATSDEAEAAQRILQARVDELESKLEDRDHELSVVRTELRSCRERMSSLEQATRTKEERVRSLQEKLDKVRGTRRSG